MSPEARDRMERDGWRFTDYVENGEVIATLIRRGAEVHLSVAPEWRGRALSRKRVLRVLTPLFIHHSFLTTRIAHDKKDPQQFVERLGFKRTWEDPMFVYYMLDTLPFQRTRK